MTKPELSTTGLLQKVEKLNKLSEVSQVALGFYLSIVKEQEAYKPEYQSFDEYYKTLGRSKGDISKLVKVGDYLRGAGFLEDTIPEAPYTLLYTSISCFPDKEPDYVISAAQTNSMSEMLENRRDDAFGSDHRHKYELNLYRKCEDCGKFEQTYQQMS